MPSGGSGGSGGGSTTGPLQNVTQESYESILTSEVMDGDGNVVRGFATLGQSVSILSGEIVPTGGDIAVSSRILMQLGSIVSGEAVSTNGGLARGGWTLAQFDSITSAEVVPGDARVVLPGILTQIASIGSGEAVSYDGELIPESVTIFAPGIASAEHLDGDGAIRVGAQILIGGPDAWLEISTAEMFDYPVAGHIVRTKGLGRRPLIPLAHPFDQMTSDEFALATGVDASAFRAFDRSFPHWRMERDYRVCAAAMGLDPYALRAALRDARNKIAGRRPPANMASNRAYGGMKNK